MNKLKVIEGYLTLNGKHYSELNSEEKKEFDRLLESNKWSVASKQQGY